MRSLTVAITTYQRRNAVLRLVAALNDFAREAPPSWCDVDVVVVVDGSTDGTREALLRYESILPMTVVWQQNAGLAAARNACLAAATGQVIWFLDDDLVPLPGAADRHRARHEHADVGVLLGPCLIPEEIEVADGVQAWWTGYYASLERAGAVTTFDQFGVANGSGPVSLFRDVGGFDETFTAYGWEDYEFGARILGSGYAEWFDAGAGAWHFTETSDLLAFRRERLIGRAAVTMFRLHPALAEDYFSRTHRRRFVGVMSRCRLHSPLLLAGVSLTTYWVNATLVRVTGRSLGILRGAAWEAAFFRGVAEADRSFLRWAMSYRGMLERGLGGPPDFATRAT